MPWMQGCRRLAALPERIGALAKLETLNCASCSALIELPESLGDLLQLSKLSLFDCVRLRRLPDCSRLTRLVVEDLPNSLQGAGYHRSGSGSWV